MNIAFVLILLIMAFYNVSGMAKEGNLALKTGLPMLVIGLIWPISHSWEVRHC